MEKLWDNLKTFVKFLFNYFIEISRRLGKARKGISPKDRSKDVVAVVSSTGMLLFLNLLALAIFIILPQGKDVIYIVSEDLLSYKFGSLMWLLFGLVLWSYVSEFASRYAIYVSDNSGVGLTDERIKWRKELQRTLSSIFLLLPYFIVLVSILVNYLQDKSFSVSDQRIGFGIPALLVYLLLNLNARVYFSDPEKVKNKSIKYLMKLKELPLKEKEWTGRLYGMYNDFVFALRKPDNFIGTPQQLLEKYIKNVTESNIKTGFPKNEKLIEAESLVPDEFKLKSFSTEPGNPAGHYRWVYYIPNKFYKKLHKQLLILVGLCLLVFLIITFLSVNGYQNIGAPALLVLSFSCWIGLYIGVLFLDYAVFRPRYKFLDEPVIIYADKLDKNEPGNKDEQIITNDEWFRPTATDFVLSRISLRFILFLLLIFCSIFNNDHPVRYDLDGSCCNDTRPPLKEHFTNWFRQYVRDTTTEYMVREKPNERFYPVVFICAEGGAMRTGAFTAMLLSYIQDKLKDSIDFHKSIYALSGTSGGALGLSFFNAEAFLNRRDELFISDSLIDRAKEFFKRDFLAPVVGKMFYGDVINLFIPNRIERFDRAIALEKSWENAYKDVINDKGRNYFSSDYMKNYKGNHTYPALFVNTTEVESGRQCWLCNVKPDTSMYKSSERDLFNYRLRGGLNYSTMINFSSRFPFFSPAATVIENDLQKYHYVDGGYTENTGTETMAEILEALTPLIHDTTLLVQDSAHMDSLPHLLAKGLHIKPYVIMIRFSDGISTFKNIDFGNELTEMYFGIYNTRSARTESAVDHLNKVVTSLHGEVIPLYLNMNKSEVPMNWVLSDRSVNYVLRDIETQYRYRMAKFFPFDKTCCQFCKCDKGETEDSVDLSIR